MTLGADRNRAGLCAASVIGRNNQITAASGTCEQMFGTLYLRRREKLREQCEFRTAETLTSRGGSADRAMVFHDDVSSIVATRGLGHIPLR